VVELVVDLNPLSRSAQVAAVPIVDNVIRAVPNVTRHARALAGASDADLCEVVETFDAEATLDAAERAIRGGVAEE
jgi:4-phosphopantoate--beta-alanine ligase